MAFTQSAGLRDREYNKFNSQQPGSKAAVSTFNNNNVKVYEFPVGSLAAWDDIEEEGGTISGGNFDSFTHYPLNGLLYGVQWIAGNNGAAGSLDIKTSGAGATTIWSTITRTTNVDFAVFPRGELCTTEDVLLGESGCYGLIPLSGYYQVIGSDIGIGLGFSGLRIAYI